MLRLLVVVACAGFAVGTPSIAVSADGDLVASVPDGNKVLIQEGTSASVDIVDEVKKATQAAADVKGFIQEQRRSTEDNAECDKTLTDVVSKVAGMIQTVKPADSTKADTSLASIAEKLDVLVKIMNASSTAATDSSASNNGIWPPAGFRGIIAYEVECKALPDGDTSKCNPFRKFTVHAHFTNNFPFDVTTVPFMFEAKLTDPAGTMAVRTQTGVSSGHPYIVSFAFEGWQGKDLKAGMDFGPLVATLTMHENSLAYAGKKDGAEIFFDSSSTTLRPFVDIVGQPNTKGAFNVDVGAHIPANGHTSIVVTSSDASIVKVGAAKDVNDDRSWETADYHTISEQTLEYKKSGSATIAVVVTDIFGHEVTKSFTAKVDKGTAETCYDWLKAGKTANGVYKLHPIGFEDSPFDAYCDMSNGGWTLFMRIATDDQYSRSKLLQSNNGADDWYAENLVKGPRKGGECGDECTRAGIAKGLDGFADAVDADQTGRYSASKLNALTKSSKTKMTRWDVGAKTWFIEKTDEVGKEEGWDLINSIFPQSTGVWGSTKGQHYEVFKTIDQDKLNFDKEDDNTFPTCTTSITFNTQGHLADPCGYGGCCWIYDGPYGVTPRGVGGCQDCSPRNYQNGYFWIR